MGAGLESSLRRGERMKSTAWKCLTGLALLAALAAPIQLAAQDPLPKTHTQYFVKDLGTLGGTQGVAEVVSNKGWVVGAANLAGDQNGRSFLWRDGVMSDLGTLGGPNSAEPGGTVLSHNSRFIAGKAETSATDPLGENFCFFSTGLICLGFFWEDGKMTPLPTLGGNNSWATAVNNRSQVVGLAENSVQDSTCIPPQVLDYEPVIWEQDRNGVFQVRGLSRIAGDPDGYAWDMNDRGQVVGVSGNCSQTVTHAVLWESGSVTDMGNLGSNAVNQANSINSRGDVVGISDTGTTISSFFWHKGATMANLGMLPGDLSSWASTINDSGQIVGYSCDQAYLSGNCRAYIWQNGVMTDLNTLVRPGSTPLYLVFGNYINSHGEIAIYALNPNNGEYRAALAIPCDEAHAGNEGCEEKETTTAESRPVVVLPENVREQLRQRRGLVRFAPGMIGQR